MQTNQMILIHETVYFPRGHCCKYLKGHGFTHHHIKKGHDFFAKCQAYEPEGGFAKIQIQQPPARLAGGQADDAKLSCCGTLRRYKFLTAPEKTLVNFWHFGQRL